MSFNSPGTIFGIKSLEGKKLESKEQTMSVEKINEEEWQPLESSKFNIVGNC